MKTLNRFNWIARHYDNLVSLIFGKTLHHAQMHFVSQIGATDAILILGGGTGNFLMDLLTSKPLITVTYIEASSEMIRLTKRKVDGNPGLTFIHGTEHHIPDQQFDVIVTNFFLDVFPDNELQPLVDTISKNLRVNGKWFVTDFENSPKSTHKFLLSLMYLFFGVTRSLDARRLPAWRSLLENKGMKLKAEKFFNDGFISASVFVKDANG